MKTNTQTLTAALRQLANDIDSPDGVANAAILEAAERLETIEADTLDREADLILAAPSIGGSWTIEQDKLCRRIGAMIKARAAILRAGGVL
jgi:hypothetical protein